MNESATALMPSLMELVEASVGGAPLAGLGARSGVANDDNPTLDMVQSLSTCSDDGFNQLWARSGNSVCSDDVEPGKPQLNLTGNSVCADDQVESPLSLGVISVCADDTTDN
jgi:hypothetical protein